MEEEIDKPLAVDVDIDPDFEPQKRPRSCTWPLPRPESNDGKAEPADVGIIPEEEVDELGSDDACASSAITGASKPVSDRRKPGCCSCHRNQCCCQWPRLLRLSSIFPACSARMQRLQHQRSDSSAVQKILCPQECLGKLFLRGPHHSSHRELAWEATDIGPGLWLDGPECAILQGQRWQQQLCWMEGTSGQRRASF